MPGCKRDNFSEQGIRQFLEMEGWAILTKGWPDFLCFREKDGNLEAMAVEAKSPKDEIRAHQEKLLNILSRYMPVYLIRDTGIENPLRIVDWSKRAEPRF